MFTHTKHIKRRAHCPLPSCSHDFKLHTGILCCSTAEHRGAQCSIRRPTHQPILEPLFAFFTNATNFNHAVGDQQKCYFHTFEFQVFLIFSKCNLLQTIFIKAFNSGFIATLFPNLVLFLCWKASRSLQRAFLLCQVILARFPGLLNSTHGFPNLLCSQFHIALGLLYSTHGAQVCCDLLAVAPFSNSTQLMMSEVCTTRIPNDVHVSSLFCY